MKNFLCVLIFSTFLGSSFNIFTIGSLTINIFRMIFLFFLMVHCILNSDSTNTEESPVAIKYKNYLWFIVFFNIFTVFQTPDFLDWVNGCVFYAINILLIYFVYIYTESKKDLEKYIKAFILGIMLTIVVSIYEYITGNHIISTNYFSEYSNLSWQYELLSLAPTGFLYNPNNIGVVMVLGLGFGLYFTEKIEGWLFFSVWAALCIYVSFATGSRGAIVMIFLAILFSVFLGTKGYLKKNIILIFLIILGIYLFTVFNDFIFEQLKRAGFSNGNNSISSDSRWDLIRYVLKSCVNTVFMGTGPMTAETVLRNNFNLSMSSVHNFWAEFLLTQGIGSFICFIAFYLRCIKVQWRLRANDTISPAILVALIMFALVVFIPPTVVTLYFVWLIFGFSIAAEKIYYNDTGNLI